MMQLQGTISLKDAFSSPMKQATTSMQHFQNQMKQATDATGRLRDANGRFVKGGKQATGIFDGLTRSAGGFAGIAGSLPGAVAGIGAGMAALGSLSKAAEFEAQMSSISAVTGASGAEMKKLTDLAMDLGSKTSFSSLQAAQGLEELLKSGLTPAQVQAGGLESALNLASAGGLELAEAAEIMSTALNSFKADGMSASQASNILAGAANASATSVGELKYGLSMVSSVASGMGVSFEDVNTALAVFAQNGLRGSDGGTSLKTMLMNLSPATKAASEQMMDLGLVTADGTNKFFDAQGNMKSMADIAGLLKTSLSGLNAEQRTNALRTMFGADAIRAANILYKEGADGVKTMNKEMSKVTAMDVAKEKMNNAKGAMEQLSGAMETLQIALGTAALPAVKELATWMANLTEKLQSGGKLSGFTTGIKALGKALVALKEPLAIAGIVTAVTLAISGLATVLGVVVSPIGAVVAGIALVGWAFMTAYKKSETFRNAVSTVITTVKAKFAEFKAFFDANGGQIFDAWINATSMLRAVFAAVLPVLQQHFVNVFNGIKAALSGFLTFAQGLVQVFTGIFTGDFSMLWDGVKAIFVGAFQFITSAFSTLFLNPIKTLFTVLFTVVTTVAQTGWALITGLFDAGVAKAGQLVSSGMETIKSYFGTGVDYLKTKASDALNRVKEAFSSKFEEIKGNVSEWASQLPSTLYDAFAGAIGALSGIGTLVWNQIKDTLPSISDITDYVTGFFGGGSGGNKSGGRKADGSHASGAFRIPYNGYMAKLHSGEAVLTASQASALRSAGVLQRSNGNLATVDPHAGAVAVPVGGGAQRPFSINIAKMEVRNDSDINSIAGKLADMMSRAAHS